MILVSQKHLHIMKPECVFKIAQILILEYLTMIFCLAVLKNVNQPDSYLVILIIICVLIRVHHLTSLTKQADNVCINAQQIIFLKLCQIQMWEFVSLIAKLIFGLMPKQENALRFLKNAQMVCMPIKLIVNVLNHYYVMGMLILNQKNVLFNVLRIIHFHHLDRDLLNCV